MLKIDSLKKKIIINNEIDELNDLNYIQSPLKQTKLDFHTLSNTLNASPHDSDLEEHKFK